MDSEAGENGSERTESFTVLSEGTIIGHYKVIRKIGSGGMGEVFLAEDTELNRRVALKFLPFQYASDEGFKTRFKREAQAAAALSHPNVVTIYEVAEHQGRPFFAMEHVEGRSLKELAVTKELSLDEIVNLTIQICEGLQEAHSANIVHRDIKPSNILISKSGRPKLVDFGLAAISGEERLTRVGTTMGTVGYMSPEQVRGKEVDQRSDIFSLGVVLYEAIAGRPPFEGDTEAATLNSILNDTPEPLARYKSGVPGELQRIVERALDKDVETRYQTATGVLADLKRVKKATDLGLATRTYIAPRGKPRSGVKRVLVPGLILAAVVFMILMLQPWKIEIRPTQDVVAAENRLAIMYFDNLADPEDENRIAQMITSLLITDLSESEYMQVVSRQRLYDILRLLGKEDLKVIDKTVASQVAEKAGVKWILTGDILRVHPNIVLSWDISERATGKILATRRVTGETGEDLFSVADKLSAQVKEDLSLPQAAKKELDRPVADVTTTSPEAYRYYLEGVDYYFKVYFAEAEVSFNKALEYDSTFAMAYFWLALLKGDPEARGMVAKAVKYCDKASQKERHYIRSVQALTSDDYQAAIKELEKSLERCPEDKFAFLMLGSVYWKHLRELEEAVRQLNRAIAIDPLYKFPYNMLAYVYNEMGDFERSIWAINKYVSLAPNEANPYDSRGDLYAYNGRLDQAMESYRKALELKPDYHASLLKLGHMYLFKREHAKAESCYKELASCSEKEVRSNGRSALALIPLSQGKLVEALKILDHGLAADRIEQVKWEPIGKHLSKAWIYSEVGDFDSALGEARLAQEIYERRYPEDRVRSRHMYAYFLAASGKFAEAEELLQVLRKELRGDSQAVMDRYWWVLGAVELMKGNAEAAVTHLGEVVKRAPLGSFVIRYLLAQAYLESGRLGEAVSELERITSSYSASRAVAAYWSAKTHYTLGLAYERSGWNKKAIEQYDCFLEIVKDADPGIEAIEDAKRRLRQLRGVS